MPSLTHQQVEALFWVLTKLSPEYTQCKTWLTTTRDINTLPIHQLSIAKDTILQYETLRELWSANR